MINHSENANTELNFFKLTFTTDQLNQNDLIEITLNYITLFNASVEEEDVNLLMDTAKLSEFPKANLPDESEEKANLADESEEVNLSESTKANLADESDEVRNFFPGIVVPNNGIVLSEKDCDAHLWADIKQGVEGVHVFVEMNIDRRSFCCNGTVQGTGFCGILAPYNGFFNTNIDLISHESRTSVIKFIDEAMASNDQKFNCKQIGASTEENSLMNKKLFYMRQMLMEHQGNATPSLKNEHWIQTDLFSSFMFLSEKILVLLWREEKGVYKLFAHNLNKSQTVFSVEILKAIMKSDKVIHVFKSVDHYTLPTNKLEFNNDFRSKCLPLLLQLVDQIADHRASKSGICHITVYLLPFNIYILIFYRK